ncbi:hypothetical protein, partial [Acidaminococcus intestini]|uniref:hypothetical protein n=1 Tax=Acidaminococcus intestini TaxID=187327 RepID=UPI00307FA5E5
EPALTFGLGVSLSSFAFRSFFHLPFINSGQMAPFVRNPASNDGSNPTGIAPWELMREGSLKRRSQK